MKAVDELRKCDEQNADDEDREGESGEAFHRLKAEAVLHIRRELIERGGTSKLGLVAVPRIERGTRGLTNRRPSRTIAFI